MLSVYDGVSYKEYVYLNGMKVAVVENGVINYIHNNYLGVPAVITDANANVVWEGDYKPFGEMYDVNGTLSNNIRFPGQYKNEESGYSYNYYRDYDPTIGRYLQSDPIGLNGGINTYGYVGGNPVSYVDPLGLKPCTCKANSISGYSNGVKQCSYTCKTSDGEEFSFVADGNDLGSSDHCEGANIKTRPTASGDVSTYSDGYSNFKRDTNENDYILFKSNFQKKLEEAYNDRK